jgi:two-component system, OmpR family, KDP operon response regulator KdpE
MSKGKVLVVDDDPFVLKSVRATLEGAGYDVATYRSAITVPLELREQKPDLVLLDITMPDLVAKDAVKAMKKLRIMEGVPIVLFSSKDEKELEEAVVTAGAHGYIAKGLDRELVAGIERFMPRART